MTGQSLCVGSQIIVRNLSTAQQLSAFGFRQSGGLPAALTETFDIIACRPSQVRMAAKMLCLQCQFFGQPLIVGVKEGDPVTASGPNTGISCSTGAGVVLADIADLAAVGSGGLAGAVGGTVIDNNNFLGRTTLGQHAVNRPAKPAFIVVGRNYDTDFHRQS